MTNILAESKFHFLLFFSTRDPDGRMLLDIFDENLHPLSVISSLCFMILFNSFSFALFGWPVIWKYFLHQKSEVPPDYDKHNPEQKQIYRFVRTLFSAAQLTAECAIVTLVSALRMTAAILCWMEWCKQGLSSGSLGTLQLLLLGVLFGE